MDTSRDLTLNHSFKGLPWSRTQHTLGSDHYIIAIQVPHTQHSSRLLTRNLMNWDAIGWARRQLPDTPIQDIDHWVASLLNDITAHTLYPTPPHCTRV